MKPKTVMRRSDKTHGVTVRERHKPTHQGLMAGSVLLTLNGQKAVDDIKVGMRVITRGSGTAIVRRVAVHQIKCDVVRILAGSIGDNQPDRDVLLLADQKILVRDWRAKAMFRNTDALVTVTDLIDDEFVTLEPGQTLTVYEIEFDTPQILYVDGLEVLSYDARFAVAKAA